MVPETKLNELMSADLSDIANALVLADALEENGRTEEAEIARNGDRPFLYDNEIVDLFAIVVEINDELIRLGVAAGTDDCNRLDGLSCRAEGNLPLGIVAIGDGMADDVYGPAVELLERISAIPTPEEGADPADTTDRIGDSIGDITEVAEPSEWLEAAQTNELDEEVEDLVVSSLNVNSGQVWYFYPNDNDWMTFNRIWDYSGKFLTKEDAMEAAQTNCDQRRAEQDARDTEAEALAREDVR